MCKALLDVDEFSIRNGYGCCKCQKDGREQCEKKDSEACHGHTGECQEFTRGRGNVGRRRVNGETHERQEIRMKIRGCFYTWGNVVTQRIVYGVPKLVAGTCRQMGVASRSKWIKFQKPGRPPPCRAARRMLATPNAGFGALLAPKRRSGCLASASVRWKFALSIF